MHQLRTKMQPKDARYQSDPSAVLGWSKGVYDWNG